MRKFTQLITHSTFYKTKIYHLHSLLWLSWLLTICTACDSENELSVIPPSDVNNLDRYFTEAMEERSIPALSFAVIQGDSLMINRHYGSIQLGEDKLPTDTTVYQIASATKLLSGTLAMTLVEENLISLDDTLGLYFEDIPKTWKSITLRQTLSHTSGLPSIMNPQTGALIAPSPEASLKDAQRLDMNSNPGSCWQYNQLGVLLAQQVMEKVSGLSWDSLLAVRILKPAGMLHSTYDSAQVSAHQAVTYLVMDQEDPVPFTRSDEVLYPDALHAAGGLHTSTQDLLLFAKSLHGDSLLDQAAKEEMWTNTQLNDGSKTKYGIGWEVGEMNGYNIVSHSGGMKAVFSHFPEEKLTIIILTNAIGALPQDMIKDLSGLFLPDTDE